MGRNTTAMKRGWNYDYANARLSAMVDGQEAFRLGGTTTTTPQAMGTATSHRMVISFTTGLVTDYSTGIYALHATSADRTAGGVMGVIYGRNDVGHTTQDDYGVRGRVAVTMAASEAANLLVGVMAQASITGAFTLTVADSVKGLDASVTQAATSTLTTGSIRAIYADVSGILKNNAGRTQGIFVKQGGGSSAYPDYGILCHLESNNLLAAIMLRTATSCVAPIGLQLNGAGGGTITDGINVTGTLTNVLAFDSATCDAYNASFTGQSAAEPDASFQVEVDGHTLHVYCFPTPVS